MALRKVMKPALEDLSDMTLWDCVAMLIAGIIKEDEAQAAEEENEELEGYTTKTKVMIDTTCTSNTTYKPNTKHTEYTEYTKHTKRIKSHRCCG